MSTLLSLAVSSQPLFSLIPRTHTRSSGLSEWRPCSVSTLPSLSGHCATSPHLLLCFVVPAGPFFFNTLDSKVVSSHPLTCTKRLHIFSSLEVRGKGREGGESTPGAEYVLYVFCQWNGCRVSFTILGCLSGNGTVAKNSDGQLDILTFSSGGVLSSFPSFNVYSFSSSF